jgi:hypothetical protein
MIGATGSMKIKINIHLLTALGVFVFFLNGAFAQAQSQANANYDEILKKPEGSYTADSLRDPFISTVQFETVVQPGEEQVSVPDAVLPPLAVQGIFWGGKFPQAIINNKIVKVDDTVDGAQVVAIEKNSVTVVFSNKQFVLPSPVSENLAASSTQKNGQIDVKKGGN